ncbi:MAG TPA: LysR family transcriptional regulator [Stellaceae bacterium]|nr:LysR family transcriptional regulator [Stellaceae bacterium]
MDIRQLRLFLTIFDHRNISTAAEVMGTSQPALSKQIRRLEEDLGVPLFDRLPRGVMPTIYGEALEDFARTIDSNYRSATRHLDALRTGGLGLLAIGAGSTWRYGPLPAAIAQLIDNRPGIRVQVTVRTTDERIAMLQRGELDMVLTAITPDITADARLLVVPVMRHTLRIIVRKGHPMTAEAPLTLADLSRLRWALPTATTGRARFDQLFHAAGLTPPPAAIEADDMACLLKIVAESDLAAYAPDARLKDDQAACHLGTIACPEAEKIRETGIVLRRGSTLPPIFQTLIDELRRIGCLGEQIPASVLSPSSSIRPDLRRPT